MTMTKTIAIAATTTIIMTTIILMVTTTIITVVGWRLASGKSTSPETTMHVPMSNGILTDGLGGLGCWGLGFRVWD